MFFSNSDTRFILILFVKLEAYRGLIRAKTALSGHIQFFSYGLKRYRPIILQGSSNCNISRTARPLELIFFMLLQNHQRNRMDDKWWNFYVRACVLPMIFWFFDFVKFKYHKNGSTVSPGLWLNVLQEYKFTPVTNLQFFSLKCFELCWSFLNSLISWPVEKSEVETSPSGRCSSPLQWSLQARK